MALSIKQLNGDASILLSFEPIVPFPEQQPFRILLDPWITGASHIVHSRISSTTHTEAACVSSLQDLPEPDLVIISQDKTDHCNEATLKQLPKTQTKTLILAEQNAAKTIRSWRHFDKEKVKTLQRWEDPRTAGRETSTRVTVPPHTLGGDPGEVTVSFICQKRDLKGLHSAVGITYRPPPSRSLPFQRPMLTPPDTPKSPVSGFAPRLPSPPLVTSNTTTFNPATFSDPAFNSNTLPTPPGTPGLTQSLRSMRSTASLSPHSRDRAISVIFSPHGISYSSLEPWATTHLLAEAALPLTALLHCFDTVSNPWWLGGTMSAGMPVGQEIASALLAQAWISTHDADKNVKGLASKLTGRVSRIRKYKQEEVRQGLEKAERTTPGCKSKSSSGQRTEILTLKSGEEVTLTSEGVWRPEALSTGLRPPLLPLRAVVSLDALPSPRRPNARAHTGL